MSRAVTGVFGTTVAAPPSSHSTAKSKDSGAEGSAFGDALNRAKASKAGEKKALDSNTAASGTASKTGKAAGGRQSFVKKPASQEDTEQAKVQKKAEAQSSEDAESDLTDQSTDSGTEQPAEDSKKEQKKTLTVAAPAAQDTAAAIVQFQSTVASPNEKSAGSDSPKEDASPKKSRATVAPMTTPQQSGAQRASNADASSADENAMPSESSDGTSTEVDSIDDSASSPKSRLAIQPADAKERAAGDSKNLPAAETQKPALASPPTTGVDAVAASQAAAIGPAVPSAKSTSIGADDLRLHGVSQQSPSAPSDSTTATDDGSDLDGSQASSGTQFATANHPRIISSITGRLLPNGGSMQIRLDPPELGAMQVRVEMRDGAMSASFETSSDQATRLLSHSLGDLRSALAAQGVNVEKLQVSQSPKQQQTSSGDSQKDDSQNPQDAARQQEQQRKEMVRRMWQKLMGGSDPVDLVA